MEGFVAAIVDSHPLSDSHVWTSKVMEIYEVCSPNLQP